MPVFGAIGLRWSKEGAIEDLNIPVRSATKADSEGIALLMSALGYPTSSPEMCTRLETILADDNYATLVACDGEEIVGFIGTRVGPLYESNGQYGQIMALFVATDHQRRGIGQKLLQTAEAMLIARGVCVLVVTSGNQRPDAHAFYEKNGFAFTGRRYRKNVGASA